MRQNMKYQDLTQGKITSGLWKFALPLLFLLKGSSHGTWADMIHLPESP